MTLHSITSSSAPAPVGPYSQAIVSGDLLFCSGQIGLDPTTSTLVAGGIDAEATQVLSNLKAVLEAAGCTCAAVIKTEIFMTNIEDFGKVNEIYGTFFSTDPAPARQTIGVAALPKGAVIEISCIAQLHP